MRKKPIKWAGLRGVHARPKWDRKGYEHRRDEWAEKSALSQEERRVNVDLDEMEAR